MQFLLLLLVPRHRRSTLGRPAFSVAGPMAWNALPPRRPPRPVAQCRQFPEEAKDTSVSEYTWTLSALEALHNALYKCKTYLLTYLLAAFFPNEPCHSLQSCILHRLIDCAVRVQYLSSLLVVLWHVGVICLAQAIA